MAFLRAAVLWGILGLSAAGTIERDGTRDCPSLQENWEATLDSLFARLPEHYIGDRLLGKEPSDLVQILPGLSLGNMTVTGLNKLEPDRPYQTFCKGGLRVILFSVVPTSLEFSIPFVSCFAGNGTIRTRAKLVRFEGQIKVNKLYRAAPNWYIPKLSPVVLEEISVELEGPGGAGESFFEVFGYLFSGALRSLWAYFASFISYAMMDTAKQANIQFDGISIHHVG